MMFQYIFSKHNKYTIEKNYNKRKKIKFKFLYKPIIVFGFPCASYKREEVKIQLHYGWEGVVR